MSRKNMQDRNALFDYLQDKYEVTKLPKAFFIKMSNIFNGKLNGLAQPIPPHHMLDMWQRKAKFLDVKYQKKKSMGQEMDGYARINYDLAIILSKYGDYLKWLDKQASQKAEDDKIMESVTITPILQSTFVENRQGNDDDNIYDELDEFI